MLRSVGLWKFANPSALDRTVIVISHQFSDKKRSAFADLYYPHYGISF